MFHIFSVCPTCDQCSFASFLKARDLHSFLQLLQMWVLKFKRRNCQIVIWAKLSQQLPSFSARLFHCVMRGTTNRDLLCDRASSWSSLNNKGCNTRRHFSNCKAGHFRIEEFYVTPTFRHLKLSDDWGCEFFAHICPILFGVCVYVMSTTNQLWDYINWY